MVSLGDPWAFTYPTCTQHLASSVQEVSGGGSREAWGWGGDLDAVVGGGWGVGRNGVLCVWQPFDVFPFFPFWLEVVRVGRTVGVDGV
jgi:hypothetical protein